MSTFTQTVQEIVKAIPPGNVMTYQAVAKAANNPKAARAVANIMAKNFNPEVPCHRVIKSDGSLGGYNRGGTLIKRSILESEGYNSK